MQQAKKINDEINFGCMWEAIDYKLPVENAIVNPIYWSNIGLLATILEWLLQERIGL